MMNRARRLVEKGTDSCRVESGTVLLTCESTVLSSYPSPTTTATPGAGDAMLDDLAALAAALERDRRAHARAERAARYAQALRACGEALL